MKATLAMPTLVTLLAGGVWAQAQVALELKTLGDRPWSLVMDEHPAPGTYKTGPLGCDLQTVRSLDDTPRGTHTVGARERQVIEWAGIPDGDWGQVFTLVDADGRNPGVNLRVVLGEEDGKPVLKASLAPSRESKGIEQDLLDCVGFPPRAGEFVIAAEDYKRIFPTGEPEELPAPPKTPAREERKDTPGTLPGGPPGPASAVAYTPIRTPSVLPPIMYLQSPLPTRGAYDAAKACAFGQPLQEYFTPSRVAPLVSFSPDAAAGAPAAIPLPPGPHTPLPGVFKVREALGGLLNDTENDRWELTPFSVPEPMVYFTESAWRRYRTGILAQGSLGPTLSPGEKLTFLISSPTQLPAVHLLSRASERDENGQVLREARMQLFNPFSPGRIRPVLPPGPVDFGALENDPESLLASGGADYELVRTGPGRTVIRSVDRLAPLSLAAEFAALSLAALPGPLPAGDEPEPPLTEADAW